MMHGWHREDRRENKTALDLSPARWIWFPSARTLANTFVLFRRELHFANPPVSARGWISADSRYRLTLNGQRVQWGPAPSDPRWPEADPIDLTSRLQLGKNVLGVEVLFYGHGDGTWPLGKPGLLLNVEINFGDGAKQRVVSDESWLCFLDRAHRPGQYRRWYLRALQEEFDARLYPFDWDTPQFQPDTRWLPAQLLSGRADKPAFAVSDPEYSSEMGLLILMPRKFVLAAFRCCSSITCPPNGSWLRAKFAGGVIRWIGSNIVRRTVSN